MKDYQLFLLISAIYGSKSSGEYFSAVIALIGLFIAVIFAWVYYRK